MYRIQIVGDPSELGVRRLMHGYDDAKLAKRVAAAVLHYLDANHSPGAIYAVEVLDGHGQSIWRDGASKTGRLH